MLNIRSQIGHVLTPYSGVYVKNNCCRVYDMKYDLTLGEYTSTERAYEVVDMIQDKVLSGTSVREAIGGGDIFYDTIFLMPKE